MPSRPRDGWSARLPAWLPYWAPYALFLVVVEVGRRAPAGWDAALLVLKSTAPLAIVAACAARGAYPELRAERVSARGVLLDLAVGVASAAMWVAPYLLFGALRPERGDAFDPGVFGAGHEAWALGVRALGYAVGTPFVEELLVRSWLPRFVDALDGDRDFRELPVARFSRRSFAAVTLWFVGTHRLWEWPVALPWVVLTNLWLVRRGHLGAVVRVHAAANASILLFAATCGGVFHDAAGRPLPLWFLV